MTDPKIITPDALEKYVDALSALSESKRRFGRELDESAIAELHVAKRLGLHFSERVNQPGYDLQGPTGLRYQVKCRAPGTLNVDLNNFDFDYVVVVNVSTEYESAAMWRMPAATARDICVWRANHRKYQVTQAKFKKHAEALQLAL